MTYPDWARILCPDCDDNGERSDQTECRHQSAYVVAAERGASAARAAIRPPKLPVPTGDPS